MILFVIYAAAVWSGAYFLRRRPLGIVVAALSPVPVIIGTWMLSMWLRKTQSTPTHILVVFPIAYGVVITAGAWFAALARRLPRKPCLRCGYDLDGNLSGLCPECGTPVGSHATPEWIDGEEALIGGDAPGAVQAALASRRARTRESANPSPSTSAAPAAATSATNPQ